VGTPRTISGNPVGTRASTRKRTPEPPPQRIAFDTLCAMRDVWGAHAHNTHDASGDDTATVADDASLAYQGDGRNTTLNASQASSTPTNCV
jgi:hypothetical protein